MGVGHSKAWSKEFRVSVYWACSVNAKVSNVRYFIAFAVFYSLPVCVVLSA